MKQIKVITWARWTHLDPYAVTKEGTQYKTTYTASVLKPSYEFPVPCVSMSVVSTTGKIFQRFVNVPDLQRYFMIPEEFIPRLFKGYALAVEDATKLQLHQSFLRAAASMTNPMLVDGQTGELIAEAEAILKKAQE